MALRSLLLWLRWWWQPWQLAGRLCSNFQKRTGVEITRGTGERKHKFYYVLAAQTPLGLHGPPLGGFRGPPGLADLCQQEQCSRKRLRALSKGAWGGCSQIPSVWDTELSLWRPGLVPAKGVGQAWGMEGHWPIGYCDNYSLVSLKVPVSLVSQLQRALPLK